MVVVYFTILSQYLPAKAEENHYKPGSGELVNLTVIQTKSTSRTRVLLLLHQCALFTKKIA